MNYSRLLITTVFTFFLNQPYVVFASTNYPTFQSHHLNQTKDLKSTHDLAKKILSLKPNQPTLLQTAKDVLTGPNEKLPQLKIENKKLSFQWKGKKYVLSHISGSQYRVNGQVVDFNDPNWIKKYSIIQQEMIESFLIPKAHAMAPVYFVIWGVVFILGAGCIVTALDSYNSNSSIQAKWIRVDRTGFNKAMEQVRREFRKTCGAANADAFGNQMDYAKFFDQYCSQVASSIEQNRPRRAPDVRLPDNSVNPAFIEDMRRRPRQYGLNNLQEDKANSIAIDFYSFDNTQHLGTRRFNELDGVDQDLIEQFASSPEFMSECVNESFNPPQSTDTIEATEGEPETSNH